MEKKLGKRGFMNTEQLLHNNVEQALDTYNRYSYQQLCLELYYAEKELADYLQQHKDDFKGTV